MPKAVIFDVDGTLVSDSKWPLRGMGFALAWCVIQASMEILEGSVKNLGQPACRSQVDQPG